MVSHKSFSSRNYLKSGRTIQVLFCPLPTLIVKNNNNNNVLNSETMFCLPWCHYFQFRHYSFLSLLIEEQPWNLNRIQRPLKSYSSWHSDWFRPLKSVYSLPLTTGIGSGMAKDFPFNTNKGNQPWDGINTTYIRLERKKPESPSPCSKWSWNPHASEISRCMS